MFFGVLSLVSIFINPYFIPKDSDSGKVLLIQAIVVLPIGMLGIFLGVLSLIRLRKHHNRCGSILVVIGFIATGIAFTPFILWLLLQMVLLLHLYVT